LKSLVVAILITALVCAALSSQRARPYARPDEFETVPQIVRDQLEQRHCLIPQDPQTKELHNIVQGEFAHKGQTDWAAYCSVEGQSQVVVIWGGPSRCVGEPFGSERPIPDDELERTWDADQWGKMPPGGSYWKLSAVPRAAVATAKGIPLTPLRTPAKHDTLKRTFPGGMNLVYCKSGKWQDLSYAD
jgi:hypothetical protein